MLSKSYNTETIITYPRINNKPFACLMAKRDTKYDLAFIGISKCREGDTFSKEIGRIVAFNMIYTQHLIFTRNANSESLDDFCIQTPVFKYNIELDIAIDNFIVRCHRYFQHSLVIYPRFTWY